jgi:hypothetical protein
VEIKPEAVTYRLQVGDELTISHHGRSLTMSSDEATTVPAEASRPLVETSQ